MKDQVLVCVFLSACTVSIWHIVYFNFMSCFAFLYFFNLLTTYITQVGPVIFNTNSRCHLTAGHMFMNTKQTNPLDQRTSYVKEKSLNSP